MKRIFSLLLFVWLGVAGFAQTTAASDEKQFKVVRGFNPADSALAAERDSFKSLPVKKFYNVSLTTFTDESGDLMYKENDKQVSKDVYDKYQSTWVNMVTCKPCILQTYNEQDVLIREAVQNQDCPMGYQVEYDANGKVRELGHNYLCNREGIWTYFDTGGKITRIENYSAGKLSK